MNSSSKSLTTTPARTNAKVRPDRRQNILDASQRLWKAAKVVNRPRFFHRRELPAPREPVRRDAQNELRLWVFAPELFAEVLSQDLPALTVNVVFDSIHRVAVPQKQDWHTWRGFQG